MPTRRASRASSSASSATPRPRSRPPPARAGGGRRRGAAHAPRPSPELVRLVGDAPLPEPLDSLEMKGIPKEPLREFLEDQGFRSLLARLNGTSQVQAPSTSPTVRPVQAEVRPEPKI